MPPPISQSSTRKFFSGPTQIDIPNFSPHFKSNFSLRFNHHRKQVSAQSRKWFFRYDALDAGKHEAYDGLNVGLLASVCYPTAGFSQLRVATDFLTYLFYLDDISDDMDNRNVCAIGNIMLNSLNHPVTYQPSSRIGTMARDFYKRMLPTAMPGCQNRFIEAMDTYFWSVNRQAHDRAVDNIPRFDDYVLLRRDTSACKPCWAMIEYANNLNIPEEVMSHPIIRLLEDSANDFVSWSNDIFSYNKEQSKGDTHNLITVVMAERKMELQTAIDYAAELCKQAIDSFVDGRTKVPSWSPEIDKDVATYIDGLASWIVGIVYWSFETERYFGKAVKHVKANK